MLTIHALQTAEGQNCQVIAYVDVMLKLGYLGQIMANDSQNDVWHKIHTTDDVETGANGQFLN